MSETIERMVASQRHRGPDAEGIYLDPSGTCALGHNRLSILDLSSAGSQPMWDPSGRYAIVFNGEIYNYLELRREFPDHSFRSSSDTEVLLAAYERWGDDCLEHLIGMFAFVIWDSRERRAFGARDRFGVKPLHYLLDPAGTLFVASEISGFLDAGLVSRPDPVAWSSYLAAGVYDHSERTFWENVRSLQPGHCFAWQDGRMTVRCWYELGSRITEAFDSRALECIEGEYLDLLLESVKLRFRSDVPVGINLSGGLDSSILLGLVQAVDGEESQVQAFTYITGDPAYDELPWVERMLEHTRHPSVVCRLTPAEVPELAASVARHESEPFGGLPTLAYAKVFEAARARGVKVLMDGQGMDEQWAGYDYYAASNNGNGAAPVQGTKQRTVRPEFLIPEFAKCSEPFEPPRRFADGLRHRQYCDTRFTKIPRALRFNDRVSMRSSVELREPFLDHRLFELAFHQPAERKIVNGTRKWLLRRIGRKLLPREVAEAPKRPVQTPQREWLRGPLVGWANDCIEAALARWGGSWLDTASVRAEWKHYCEHDQDHSFFIWQWISLGLMSCC
ncbi:MAG: asparagine synthase (glutamine-hydrolyzing) [Acidobacteriia bacterium]|nr:asparagine synthase (glutamine-hydrolyzing) [Terriglobia bacterium]